MKAKRNDWIMFKVGPHMKIGVVRYVLKEENYSYGKEQYQTDEHRVSEEDVYEVRPPTDASL